MLPRYLGAEYTGKHRPSVTSGPARTLCQQRYFRVANKKRVGRVRAPRPVFIDDDMIDWFLADPLAAAEFLREYRVQVLEDGTRTDEAVSVMILTRDSVPGLGLAC